MHPPARLQGAEDPTPTGRNPARLFGLPARRGRWLLIPVGMTAMLSLGTVYLLSLLFAPHGALRHQRPASSHLQA